MAALARSGSMRSQNNVRIIQYLESGDESAEVDGVATGVSRVHGRALGHGHGQQIGLLLVRVILHVVLLDAVEQVLLQTRGRGEISVNTPGDLQCGVEGKFASVWCRRRLRRGCRVTSNVVGLCTGIDSI